MLERVWRKGDPLALLVGMCRHYGEQCGDSFYKVEIELPYDTVIPLLGKHTMETRIERDRYTPMFTAALFTVARTWKQSRCLLTDEWIKKLLYIFTLEYYSAIKRNAFESVLMRWMNIKPIIQSAVKSERERQKSYISAYIWNLERWYQ